MQLESIHLDAQESTSRSALKGAAAAAAAAAHNRRLCMLIACVVSDAAIQNHPLIVTTRFDAVSCPAYHVTFDQP